MKLQLLSDLHLETETFDPEPAPDAELLVLAGDIDATWAGLDRFAGWPVPVIYVAGNHEFDRRELRTAWTELRGRVESLGWTMLECQSEIRTGRDGRRVRFVGTVRWSDFDVFGAERRPAALRAAAYFQHLMAATRDGQPFGPEEMAGEARLCRDWLDTVLRQPAEGRWDCTVAITHFAPSLHSADPRFGLRDGTASFCNADDDLLLFADLWLHGHLHCRHDYGVHRPGHAPARVVCQARGTAEKGEPEGFEPLKTIEV